ncbi:hypothetical protein N181_29170 [Sinorhizobium fredii USDA 205]|uniref:Uncharacterized protein n=1 Tax=Rhizobium fredii TaxID=380 RepID=A0A844A5F4_RHIFR|nr:hypothetical protein [Sinorhizobium fredii]KSV80464.1 hypothetical protein N181_29170 [Sinorhizobium fredii USDA 205]MQW99062.1 hypothetical protein [Sinorhizobium fredii]MQX07105.1 hypothetical protein [Sinorhizobium fredii]UTY51244.1 hypothetical protein EPK84_33040 [Sinorhizobium fredii]GEC35643.1 hypothetical protein EFR01_58140 [Sinorhizobium fredii]
MLPSFYDAGSQIFTPQDLDLMRSVFDEQIKLRGLTCDGAEAKELAVHLVELFRAGVRDGEHLRAELKGLM